MGGRGRPVYPGRDMVPDTARSSEGPLWSESLIDTLELEPWRLHAVADARFRADGGVAFSMVPRALWERETAVAPDHTIPLRIGVLLMERPGLRLVIDAGMGKVRVPRAVRGFFDHLEALGGLDRALDLLGWAPESVTHLVLSHLHVDHAGGAFDAAGRPRFSNAEIVVSRRELNYALHPHAFRGPVFDSRVAGLVADNPRVRTVETVTTELVPGISLLHLGGHTPGLMGVMVRGERATLFAPGDLMPTRAHRRPRWVLSYDQDPARVYEQRRTLEHRAMAHDWILHFTHDPRVAFGRLGPGADIVPVRVESLGSVTAGG